MLTITLTPAYGRDYKSKKAVTEDWQDNKDFIHQPSGTYANRDSIDIYYNGKTVYLKFRYNRLQRVHVVKHTANASNTLNK